jgi:uncharacterized protein YaaN involved in tellurite resistance
MEDKDIPNLNLSDLESEVKEIYASLKQDENGNVRLDQKYIDRLLSIIDELDQKITDLDNEN